MCVRGCLLEVEIPVRASALEFIEKCREEDDVVVHRAGRARGIGMDEAEEWFMVRRSDWGHGGCLGPVRVLPGVVRRRLLGRGRSRGGVARIPGGRGGGGEREVGRCPSSR